MEKIAASLLATAGIACAQTYNYDSSSETLVITGKGNTVADRITLEGPITPGSTVPGTSEIFGDTKEIILKDVWTSPDSIDLLVVAADFSAGLGVGGTGAAVRLVGHDEVMHGLGALVTAYKLDVGGSGGF